MKWLRLFKEPGVATDSKAELPDMLSGIGKALQSESVKAAVAETAAAAQKQAGDLMASIPTTATVPRSILFFLFRIGGYSSAQLYPILTQVCRSREFIDSKDISFYRRNISIYSKTWLARDSMPINARPN